MIKIKIRTAEIQDALSMSIIHANSWKKAYQGLLPEKYLSELKDSRWEDMMTKGLTAGTMKAWVAIMEDKIIACACVGNSRYKGYEGQLELISIYVLPEYWNLGAGSLLLNEVLKYALNNNYSDVGLWVLEGNEQAIRFYKKNGFYNNGDSISCMIGEKLAIEKRYIRKVIKST